MTLLMVCQLDYVHSVNLIMSYTLAGIQRGYGGLTSAHAHNMAIYIDYHGTSHRDCATLSVRYSCFVYIKDLTHMKRENSGKSKRAVDTKAEALRQQSALHPNPEIVRDEAFQRDEFFDPRDLVQVRYEMLRRHKVDGEAVTDVAEKFGISRQAYYMTVAAFGKKGIAGLLARSHGPQRAHKCSDEILDFVEQWRADASAPESVSDAVLKCFGVSIHPRSLARALARRKKNCNSAHRPAERLEQQIDWKQEYEYLRQEALHPGARRGHGLALFQSRGMMAWLQALTALKPRPAVQSVIEESARIPSIPHRT
jgi:transposase